MIRAEFTKKFRKEYDWLRKNSPDLLNNILPRNIGMYKDEIIHIAKNINSKKPSSRTKIGQSFFGYINENSQTFDQSFFNIINKLRPDWLLKNQTQLKKQQILLLASDRSQNRPSNKTVLGRAFSNYIRKGSSFDLNFYNQIKITRPDWFIAKNKREIERTYKNMILIKPKDVEFIEGQTWKGMKHKYKFNSIKFGMFTATAERLIRGSWIKGLSGHPNEGREIVNKSRKKKVMCIETARIFESARQASKSIKKHQNMVAGAIRRNCKCGGYHWAYCDENGKVL